MSLFEQSERANLERAKPLASRMRPRNLDEFIGQQHILGEGKLLRRLLKADRLGSIILFGPPGVGKTTLARILAEKLSVALGKPVVVENKPGAAATIAADQTAKAKPDGYTLLMGHVNSNAIAPPLRSESSCASCGWRLNVTLSQNS